MAQTNAKSIQKCTSSCAFYLTSAGKAGGEF